MYCQLFNLRLINHIHQSNQNYRVTAVWITYHSDLFHALLSTFIYYGFNIFFIIIIILSIEILCFKWPIAIIMITWTEQFHFKHVVSCMTERKQVEWMYICHSRKKLIVFLPSSMFYIFKFFINMHFVHVFWWYKVIFNPLKYRSLKSQYEWSANKFRF